MIYDPGRDLYSALGVPAGALISEIRSAISRRHASANARDLAEASRLLLSPALRSRYDLQRAAHRTYRFLCRLGGKLRQLATVRWQGRPARRWWVEAAASGPAKGPFSPTRLLRRPPRAPHGRR